MIVLVTLALIILLQMLLESVRKLAVLVLLAGSLRLALVLFVLVSDFGPRARGFSTGFAVFLALEQGNIQSLTADANGLERIE